MNTSWISRSFLRAVGTLGIGLFLYSAGYTRGIMVERGLPTESTPGTMFSIGNLPESAGLLAFLGIALVIIYGLGFVYLSSDGK